MGQASPIPIHPIVHIDLPCCACGYNVRGLPGTGRCPECSRSILQSMLVFPSGSDADRQRMIQAALACVAHELDRPAAAVQFLSELFGSLTRQGGQNPATLPARCVDGRLLLIAMAAEAARALGTQERAREVLAGWGVTDTPTLLQILSATWGVKWPVSPPGGPLPEQWI